MDKKEIVKKVTKLVKSGFRDLNNKKEDPKHTSKRDFNEQYKVCVSRYNDDNGKYYHEVFLMDSIRLKTYPSAIIKDTSNIREKKAQIIEKIADVIYKENNQMWVCKKCGSNKLAYYEEEVRGYERAIDTRNKDELENIDTEREWTSTVDKPVTDCYICKSCGYHEKTLNKLATWKED